MHWFFCCSLLFSFSLVYNYEKWYHTPSVCYGTFRVMSLATWRECRFFYTTHEICKFGTNLPLRKSIFGLAHDESLKFFVIGSWFCKLCTLIHAWLSLVLISPWKYLQMVNCRLGLWPLWEYFGVGAAKAIWLMSAAAIVVKETFPPLWYGLLPAFTL